MEDAKHLALLFFLDHLMSKNGKRTIHDLSCQFGARNFSEEMREAVGTTQEGLTDFLSLYPSLFTVEGDSVILNGVFEMDGRNQMLKLPGTPKSRDYEKEAIDFFVNKLQKFGPELQIKSLLGHRSQAAPEVRLVSGRHLKEFCEFLSSQVDYFVVEGDRVRLKNMPEPSNGAVELDEDGNELSGIRAKQVALDFLRNVLEQNDEQPIPLDSFYQRFCERFTHAVRQQVATNPKELLQFLKLNRNVFFIRSNKVSLVKNKSEENGSESGRSTEDSESNFSDNNNTQYPINKNSLSKIKSVYSLAPAQEAIKEILNDLNNQEEKYVAIDFKFVTCGNGIKDEFLSLIVLASQKRIQVFDLSNSDTLLLESGLRELLESPKVLKIIHDVKRVSTLLSQRYSVNMANIFDTQIAHSVIQHEKFGKSFADLRAITFLNLQRVYYPQSIMMSNITPRKLSETPSWGQRPIEDEMMLDVVEECHCLITAMYRVLSQQIPPNCQSLLRERCDEALLQAPFKKSLIPTSGGGIMNGINQANAYLNGNEAYRAVRRTNNSLSPIATQKNGFAEQPLDTPLPKRAVAPQNGNSEYPKEYQKATMCDAGTQTFSTGEIVAIKMYYD
uniref:3'-5' exonuclease domain-containing protein n=1 Tax=Rhabditophanes sp. KR3021 TaxID=114890 RepID=A0AC35U8U0_9BILA